MLVILCIRSNQICIVKVQYSFRIMNFGFSTTHTHTEILSHATFQLSEVDQKNGIPLYVCAGLTWFSAGQGVNKIWPFGKGSMFLSKEEERCNILTLHMRK